MRKKEESKVCVRAFFALHTIPFLYVRTTTGPWSLSVAKRPKTLAYVYGYAKAQIVVWELELELN